MKPSEAVLIAGLVQKRWPAQPIDAQRYAEDLVDLDAVAVDAAVTAVHRSGVNFAPTAGAVRLKVAQLELDVPEWVEVRRQLNERQATMRRAGGQPFEWTCPDERCDGSGLVDYDDEPGMSGRTGHCSCMPRRVRARRHVDLLHPLVREFLDQEYVTLAEFDDVTNLDHPDRATLEAQMRDKWRAFAARAIESRALRGLEADADLPRLRSGRDEDEPRRRRRGRSSPRRLDVGDLLSAPSAIQPPDRAAEQP